MSIVQRFATWVRDNREVGVDGSDQPAYYVPHSKLKEYWTYHHIYDAINETQGTTTLLVREIANNYLLIFSTLVYITERNLPALDYLGEFISRKVDDTNLPNFDQSIFLKEKEVSEAFQKNQFLFSPVTFDPKPHRRWLDTRAVFPLKFEKVLSKGPGDTAVIKSYQTYPASTLREKIIVMKQYPKFQKTRTFENEIGAYATLENISQHTNVSKYFLKYYGSFIQNDRGYILLEYANQGSLLDLFRLDYRPQCLEEIRSFWEKLSDLLIGLEILHGRTLDGDLRRVQFHQDLKPANIFVFRGDGPYNYVLKIGDFGLTSSLKNNLAVSPDNKGGTMYSAPETTNFHEDLWANHSGPINAKTDLWSLGCILFETAVWAVSGEEGRELFRKRRSENIQKMVFGHAEQGYGASFHDGKTRLKAVDDMLGYISIQKEGFDDITRPICDVLLSRVLVPQEHRCENAGELERLLKSILRRSSDNSSTRTQPPQADVNISRSQSTSTIPMSSSLSLASARARARTSKRQTIPSTANEQPIIDPSFRPISEISDSGKSSTLDLLGNNFSSTSSVPMPVKNGGQLDMNASIDAELKEIRANELPVPQQGAPGGNKTTVGGDTHQGPISHGTHNITKPWVSSHSNSTMPESTTETSIGLRQAPPRTPPKKSALNLPNVSINDVLHWAERRKHGERDELPGWSATKKVLSKREQIFVIDDSTSMIKYHWSEVIQTFTALAHVARMIDPNGIELYFASKPDKRNHSALNRAFHVFTDTTWTKSLIHMVVDRQNKPPSSVIMELCLSKILQRVKDCLPSPQSKETSIYILTDAVWEDDLPTGVDLPIKNLVEDLRRYNKMREHVSLHFIMFGKDQTSKNRMKHLDDDLGQQNGFDIIDCRTPKSNVWHIMLGSVSRAVDSTEDVGDDDPTDRSLEMKDWN